MTNPSPTPEPQLPTAETLYAIYFSRWMPDEDPRAPQLRSDLEEIEDLGGAPLQSLSPLTPEGHKHVAAQLRQMETAAVQDLAALLGMETPPGPDWLDALEAKATPAQLQTWLRGSDPARPDNTYFLLCCETGALIARLLRQKWPALTWLHDFPYFESSLFDLNQKVMIPVFHWAVKTLSGDERQPLRQKVEGTVDFLKKSASIS